MRHISWKPISVLILLVTALIYVLPTLVPDLWPHKTINLGLDLQGGMHLVLEVDTAQALESTLERMAHEMREALRRARVRQVTVTRPTPATIAVEAHGEGRAAFEKILDDDFRELRIVRRTQEQEVLTMVLDLPERDAQQIKNLATQQALETIRNRIDQFGVSEPDIRLQGENRILIQLAGVQDTQRAKELIGRTALLEFKLVEDEVSIQAALDGNLPMGMELLYEVREDPQTRRVSRTPLVVRQMALLTGAYLTDARVQIDSQFNEPYVGIKFDRKGGQLFEKITAENVKRRLAIVLDNTIYSAPVIQERIAGGEARITGNFSMEEARDLAIVLRAGALPAPVEILEERTVGPSLGSDSIRRGLLSMLVGGILVLAFMAIYYKGAGLLANVALLFNLVLIAGGLAAFQATLTLPGIAGIILTIGMAVDANVLIFERIREELRLGKTPRAAVEAGYERASLTILDANVTTLIAALVLFQFGTGPVKGFAVTLSLGVLASLFTALVMTRSVFDFFLNQRKIKTLSI